MGLAHLCLAADTFLKYLCSLQPADMTVMAKRPEPSEHVHEPAATCQNLSTLSEWERILHVGRRGQEGLAEAISMISYGSSQWQLSLWTPHMSCH
jgi:hypothetical protein